MARGLAISAERANKSYENCRRATGESVSEDTPATSFRRVEYRDGRWTDASKAVPELANPIHRTLRDAALWGTGGRRGDQNGTDTTAAGSSCTTTRMGDGRNSIAHRARRAGAKMARRRSTAQDAYRHHRRRPQTLDGHAMPSSSAASQLSTRPSTSMLQGSALDLQKGDEHMRTEDAHSPEFDTSRQRKGLGWWSLNRRGRFGGREGKEGGPGTSPAAASMPLDSSLAISRCRPSRRRGSLRKGEEDGERPPATTTATTKAHALPWTRRGVGETREEGGRIDSGRRAKASRRHAHDPRELARQLSIRPIFVVWDVGGEEGCSLGRGGPARRERAGRCVGVDDRRRARHEHAGRTTPHSFAHSSDFDGSSLWSEENLLARARYIVSTRWIRRLWSARTTFEDVRVRRCRRSDEGVRGAGTRIAHRELSRRSAEVLVTTTKSNNARTHAFRTLASSRCVASRRNDVTGLSDQQRRTAKLSALTLCCERLRLVNVRARLASRVLRLERTHRPLRGGERQYVLLGTAKSTTACERQPPTLFTRVRYAPSSMHGQDDYFDGIRERWAASVVGEFRRDSRGLARSRGDTQFR
ncbi:hypothetical protein SCHPADRAFT_896839 [Schizopora paradoxa]|uniref:Uncharacterized protein n=1 Tax=Schizopora paradoxa TaxID=27342 RepID=A0A0H2RIL4_9AGAM|nr:hypothetical protein SCHPADRAFT_896839 [Schizopora paradoxa]